MTYSQKYTLTHFIQPVTPGYQFHMSEWPLHITLADTFAINRREAGLDAKLTAFLRTVTPPTSRTQNDAILGTTPVALLETTPSLKNLHLSLVSLLEENGAIFNTPEFTKDGFLPHSTIQKRGRLNHGDQITITSLALVDMFPGGNWQQRKVIAVFPLGEKHLHELTQTQLKPLLKESEHAFLPSKRHPNQTTTQLNQKFLTDANYKAFGHIINGETASYIIALSGRQEGDVAIGPMYVGEAFRGRGLGKAQVEEFIARYADLGYGTVFTKTWQSNQASRSIFASLGFTEVRRTEDDRINGEASIEYELRLPAAVLS